MEINLSVANTLYGNIGRYSSIQGATAYDDNELQYTGNHVLYNIKGDICGFRLRSRRVSSSQTLSLMDSNIYCINSSEITLTLPSGAEDGQEYYIRKYGNGNITVVPASGTALATYQDWNGGSSSSRLIENGFSLICKFDYVNKKWYVNLISN